MTSAASKLQLGEIMLALLKHQGIRSVGPTSSPRMLLKKFDPDFLKNEILTCLGLQTQGSGFSIHTGIIEVSHLANGPWKKSLNFIFPTKYGIPQKFKRLAIG